MIIALILLISLCGGHGLALHAPSGLSSQAHSASPRDVSFRELAASPTQFDNQRIRLRAVWRVGEEWSDLYWPGINPGQCVLVDFNDNESTCTSRSIQRRARANEGSTFGIVLEGTFHNQAAGTVSGGCPNWIDVDCIKKLDVILPQASPTLSALSADQRRLVESWCNRGD